MTLSVIRRDRLLAHRGAVDLREVRADLPGRQALGIQRQHDLIDAGQPPLPLAHDLRLERARPGPAARRSPPGRWPRSAPSWAGCRSGRCPSRHRLAVLLMAQVLGHLLVQRRLQHRLGQLLQQPVRARSATGPAPGPAAPAPPPPAAPPSAPASASSSSHHPVSRSSRHLSRQATRLSVIGPETPLRGQSRGRRCLAVPVWVRRGRVLRIGHARECGHAVRECG